MRFGRVVWWVSGGAVAATVAGLGLYGFSLPSTQTPSMVDASTGIGRLLEEKSVDALAALLVANGEELPEGRIDIGYAISSDGPEQVEDVKRITSAGNEYVAVVVRQTVQRRERSINGSPGRALIPSTSQLAYLFDTDGHFLKRVGVPARSDSLASDELRIRTLGSSSSWFVLLMHREPTADLTSELSVYVLEDTVPKALHVEHRQRGLAYTGSAKQAKRGVRLMFMLPESEACRINADSQQRWFVRWNETDRVFEGPTEAIINGCVVYRVDTEESERFRPTDSTQLQSNVK